MGNKKRLRQTIASRDLEHDESAALLGTEAGRHHRRAPGKRSPPNRWENAAASCGLAKQNTTKSRSSRRMKYVNGATDKAAAILWTISLFFRPSTLSAGSAT